MSSTRRRDDHESQQVLYVSLEVGLALTSVQSFGIAGPDGLTVDSEGNLFICHPSLLSIFVVTPHGVPMKRIILPEGSGTSLTNCVFGSTPADRKRLYMTASTVGRICYVDWHCPGMLPPTTM